MCMKDIHCRSKVWDQQDFLCFLKKYLLLKAAFIWSKIKKNSNIVKYYYNSMK